VGFGFGFWGEGVRVSELGVGIWGFGLGGWDFGLGIWGWGFRGQGPGFLKGLGLDLRLIDRANACQINVAFGLFFLLVWGLGIRGRDSGFRVQGLGFRAEGPPPAPAPASSEYPYEG
jgi:hypothetical protein